MQKIKRLFIKLGRFIKFLTANFKGVLLLLLILYILAPTSKDSIINANLARIDLSGPIMDPEKILLEISQAQEEKAIKGVLFVINSPGGAVAPSIELAYAIKRLAQVKPVISYASGSMASGSYYAAIWSSQIIANPGSLIGSIGVIMQGYNVEELLNKIGVKTQTAKMGNYKEVGTMNRAWSSIERAEIEKVIHNTYTMFITDVAQARKLDLGDEKKFADAHIFTAKGAFEVGLIDEIGTLYEASERLKNLANVKKIIWKKPSAMDTFMDKLSSTLARSLSLVFPDLTLK